MARSWGRFGILAALVVSVAPFTRLSQPAVAAADAPFEPTPPFDPGAMSAAVEQGTMTHIFDTRTPELGADTFYVNDHTLVQDKTGMWHLFGIFHREPFGEDTEDDFIHAIAQEPDPARWSIGAFVPAPAPHTIALRADRAAGETHIWAPHVIAAEGRWVMVYQGGGRDGDRASIRLAESSDLYSWTRVGDLLFDDICVSRDPMLVRRDGGWALYYTRCESLSRRKSGVAYRLSKDLVRWSEPHMVLTLPESEDMANSGYTESPFVFERNGYYYLSVSSYPVSWDATYVFRSPAPFAFPSTPFTRLRAHAGEWLTSRDGKRMFLTHAGAGQRGVWMMPIEGL